MGAFVKIAISPAVQLGGSLFTPQQLGIISELLAADAIVEMTPFKQLYAEVPEEQRAAIQAELERNGLEVYPAGFDQQHARGKEKFSKFVDRVTLEQLQQITASA